LFWSLFHGVCDQGRIEARISTIQASCLSHLPDDIFTPDMVKAALLRMKKIVDEDGVPLIYIYPANGTKVLQIAGWWTFQGGMRNAWPSRWDAMPGWVDDIRGHGIAAMKEILANKTPPDGGAVGSRNDTQPSDFLLVNRNHNQKQLLPSLEGSMVKPWDLFSTFLESRDISYKNYPGPRIQLAHAKKMIADGFTVEDVRAACVALSQDPYWATKGFDLATIHAHYGKLKARDAAKPKAKPVKPAEDGVIFD